MDAIGYSLCGALPAGVENRLILRKMFYQIEIFCVRPSWAYHIDTLSLSDSLLGNLTDCRNVLRPTISRQS